MFNFPKERRLCGKRAIDRVFAEGRGGFVYPLKYIYMPADEVKVLVSVPKKLHKRAVRRNLLKRRMREAFRLQPFEGGHLVLIYAIKEVVEYKVIEDAVKRIINSID